MFFVSLILINYVVLTLKKIEYQFNIKYSNDVQWHYVKLILEYVKNSTQRF